MAEEQSNIETFPSAGGGQQSRRVPHNLPAEQNLLGAILLDNSTIERIDDRLRAEHFYDPLHGRIFSIMSRLIEAGSGKLRPIRSVTLKSFFSAEDYFTDTNAEEYLGELADGVISIAQAPDYATTIHEAHIRRELISVGDTVIHDASHPDVDVPASTQIEAAEAALFRLAETDQSGSGLRGFDSNHGRLDKPS